MFTVTDICELFTGNQNIAIWDVDLERIVWSGDSEDVPSKYLFAEIVGIDEIVPNNSGILTLNVQL